MATIHVGRKGVEQETDFQRIGFSRSRMSAQLIVLLHLPVSLETQSLGENQLPRELVSRVLVVHEQ